MPKVILVNPPLTMEERYGKLAPSGNRLPPLNLCHLAAVLREEMEVSIFDGALYPFTNKISNGIYEDSADYILKRSPDYIGLTATTLNIYNAAKLAMCLKNRMKAEMPKIIIGGPHITFLPEETLRRFSQFDIGVVGEGEVTLKELIKCLEENRDITRINGIIFRENGGLRRTSARDFIKDLDSLPPPSWDLLPDLAKYYCSPPHSYIRTPSGSLVSSRGCPGRCIFCGCGIFGRNLRAYSERYIIEMMAVLKRDYNIRDVYFIDDNFIAFRKRLLAFCRILKNIKPGQVWSCQARVDMVTSAILKEMREAGCWQIAYGIESGVQEILDNLKKGITLKDIRRALVLTKEAGIRTRGFFMFGNPGETEETMRETIKFVRSISLDDLHISFLTPFPGSELYSNASKFGNFINDWSRMNGWDPLFVPYGLKRSDLIISQRKAFAGFYLRPRIILGYLPYLRFPSQWSRLWNGIKGLFSLLFK